MPKRKKGKVGRPRKIRPEEEEDDRMQESESDRSESEQESEESSAEEDTSQEEDDDEESEEEEDESDEEEESKSNSSKSKSSSTSRPNRKRKKPSKHQSTESDNDEENESATKRRKTKSTKRPASSSSMDEDEEEIEAEEEGSSTAGRKRRKTPVSGPMDPDELPDEWRCSANDALTFRLIRNAPEKETAQATDLVNFHPSFTHQLWDDEEIVGYKKVKALVAFTSGALYTYVKVEYEEKYPDTDVPDIQALIMSKLTGGYTFDYEDFKSHIHDPFVPPGRLLDEYTVPSVDLSSKEIISYEVYHGRFDDPVMRAYHQRLQFFLLFFIDRSSYINDNDLVWEIILLFQKRICIAKNVTTYHIVGYTTLYKFLHYPNDWKMRLSQILILPPFQRAGHGQKLLQLVYREAETRGMIEVNIEDPSPVFQLLRDLTDINLCRRARFFEKQAGSDDDPLDHWSLEYALIVKASLRITLAQVRRCYEIFKLNAVNDRHKMSKPMVAYRLEVKARLFKEEQEVLSLYSNNPEKRKEKLAEIYNEIEQHYLVVIKKARLH